ncbi:hypothetical protein A5685_11980 [Mycobacterium colombiense]|uniref:Uncharacterized protein n=1 Tax=Mycobacterium colombiense TaxID=339268 RepID=A0A1A2RS91_9MYCO|nr:hypothetical protein A5685_11980 [Mycobacterium colombiense]
MLVIDFPDGEAATRGREHHAEDELDRVAHVGLVAAGVSRRLAAAALPLSVMSWPRSILMAM